MAAKKKRVPVVFDTNVFVRAFLSKRKTSPNKKVIRLWLLEKKLQLIVGPQVVAEYLGVFEEVLGFDAQLVEQWRERFENDPRVTVVRESKVLPLSRDPDDNIFLAVGNAGGADYLLTNDKDLLELPHPVQDRLPFRVMTPAAFMDEWGDIA